MYLVRSGMVLIGRRAANRSWYPGVWDIIGGHIEAEETADFAAQRELREELGIDIEPTDLVLIDTLQGVDFELTLFATGAWQGQPRNLTIEEHDELRWCTPADIEQLHVSDPRLAQLAARAVELVERPPQSATPSQQLGERRARVASRCTNALDRRRSDSDRGSGSAPNS